MASALYFELYEGGSLTKNTFDVYLDSSSDAVENSYYYNDATFTPQLLNGTNGFSAWTGNAVVSATKCYRIRISYQGSLRFCSAWFKWSTNGYADYIPYYGTNGPSNGLYRIAVASNSFPTSRVLSGTTSLEDIPSINKTIPCSIYLFWGGNYLSGGTTYPPIVAMTTIDYIGSTYSMYVPSSTNNPMSKNNISYCFYQHNPALPQCSYFNSYGLEGIGSCTTLLTGTTTNYNLSFSPQEGVICTGQMAEAISYYAKEFDDNQWCIPKSNLSSNGFISTETNNCLPRFNTVKKKNAIFLYTSFRTSGAVMNMAYTFSGNSNSMTITAQNFPIASAVTYCWWRAEIADFLGTTYTNTDLQKKVRVSIGEYLSSQVWYYKVVAYDGTIIKQTSRLSSDGFTTTMDKLDGAIVFFSKNSTINEYYFSGSKRARDGEKNITSTSVYCSWSGGSGGVTTSSLASIGEFDYE